jgi:hypothetical protein
MNYLSEESVQEIKDLLIPYDTEHTKLRFGRTSDGGYVFLKELLGDVNTVYSLGYGGEAEIDLYFAENGKKVYLYDDVWDSMTTTHENITYQKVFVTSEFFNNELKGVKNDCLLLCDIEGGEYEVFKNMDDDSFKRFSQIAIEIHDVVSGDRERNLEFFKKLNKHFYLTHIHGNNFVYDDGREHPVTHGVPDTIECLYVRKDLCKDVKVSDKSFPLPLIDFRNNPNREDIELNWWINQ